MGRKHALTILIFSVLILGLVFSFRSSLFATGAQKLCGKSITKKCLELIADEVILNQPVEDEGRVTFALTTAKSLRDDFPVYAEYLVKTYGSQDDLDRFQILAAEDQSAQLSPQEQARQRLLQKRAKRLKNPRQTNKNLDLLYIASNLAEQGFPRDAKETHILVAKSLLDRANTPVALRLGRLMALYGWPEDTKPWFAEAYDVHINGSKPSAYYISWFMKVAHIIGDEKLETRILEDLTKFNNRAQQPVSKFDPFAEIRAFADSGQIIKAKRRAKALGWTLDEAYCDFAPSQDVMKISQITGVGLDVPFCNSARNFLKEEMGYTPTIFPNTLVRYEAIMSALETQEAKNVFLKVLADELIYARAYPEMEQILPRVDDKMKPKIIKELMIRHASYSKDPVRAANIFKAHWPQEGYLHSFPLMLTASGLWDIGDKRAKDFTTLALEAWSAEGVGSRYSPASLINSLAKAGKPALIEPWLKAATPKEQFGIFEFAIRGATEGGHFDLRIAYLERARADFAAQEEISDAINSVEISTFIMLSETADVDAVLSARDALSDSQKESLPVLIALAKARERAGQNSRGQKMLFDILDRLLDETFPAETMPYILTSLKPD